MDSHVVTLMILLATVAGIPILRLDVCSESEATFICTVNESTSLVLSWHVDFLHGENIDRVITDTIGQAQYATHGATGVAYHFNLTSKSPLTSTMTTHTPTDLSGAIIMCSIGLSNSADMATLTLTKPSHHFNITMRTILVNESQSSLDVYLHWYINCTTDNCREDAAREALIYNITVIPESNWSIPILSSTSNTSTQFKLFSDHLQDYNISVIASNCVGTSKPAEIHITWDGRCPILRVNVNISFEYSVGGSRLMYSCLSEQPQGEISLCTETGSKTLHLTPGADTMCTNYANEGNTDIVITHSNRKDNHEITIAVSVVLILFLVVLSLMTTLLVIVWLHRRKQDSRSETQAIEQVQNEYTEVEHLHEYQDEDSDYTTTSSAHLEQHIIHHNQTEDHSTFTQNSELRNPLYQNTTEDNNLDGSLNLDSLLIQLRVEVTPKWHQFGVVIGVPEDLLQQYSNFPADECLIEVLDYWLKNCQNPTWRDVAKVLHDIELHKLAEAIMNVYETGRLPVEIDADDSDSDDNILLPLPVPANMLPATEDIVNN